jgi:hypothetical protein
MDRLGSHVIPMHIDQPSNEVTCGLLTRVVNTETVCSRARLAFTNVIGMQIRCLSERCGCFLPLLAASFALFLPC